MDDSPRPKQPTFYEQLVTLERQGHGFVLVTLVDALGSTPQDAGAKMIVTEAGRHAGTVGGGRVEARAIAVAQEMITSGERTRLVNWTLKGDVGMTCGGAVKLFFEAQPGDAARWTIAIFGAGHIAQALVPVLVPLPCSIVVCDSRREWLDQISAARNVRLILQESPSDLVPTLPAGSFVICMTKGHTTDRPILQRALLERDFPFIGVIGSEAKAAVLRCELIDGGVPAARVNSIHCPLGLSFGTNHPHEIALSIAAQLLVERDRIRARSVKPESLPG